MGISVREIKPEFGAEIGDVALTADMDDATFTEVLGAFNRYGVLIFHDQAFSEEEQVAFSRRFGALETSIRFDFKRPVRLPETSDISNIDAKGRKLDVDDARARYARGNQMWHTDSSFKAVPAMASLLYAVEVAPEGGETEFADLRGAWDALPADRQAFLDGKVAEHDFIYSRGLMGFTEFSDEERARTPPVLQTMVRRHPATGRKNLYLGSHASHIIGMDVDEGREILRDLLEFATRPEFVISHRWAVGDLVMWDNRRVLHRGRPWDETRYRRVKRRTTVAGTGPTVIAGKPVDDAA